MNSKGENLTVIITTQNRLEYTKRTLESLKRTVPEALFVIVDSASSEKGMLEYLRVFRNRGYTRLMEKSENEGWGKAVNDGVELCGEWIDDTRYVLFSNNDVEYKDGWYEKAVALYEKYPKIGVLGLWKHIHHGVMKDYGDLVTKDQMPATCWLLKPQVMRDIGKFAVHGPCLTKGGNGEDTDFCTRAEWKGYWVAGPKEDLAEHMDGYHN